MSFFTFKLQKPKDEMDFEACRFDFRLDAKNGLTPSKRKKSERRGTCYNTLFKCKVCGSLFDNRAALLEHKLVHNDHKCPICDVKVARKATLKEHLNVIHGLGKVKEPEVAQSDAKVDQKAALRAHIRVVRGLARKARAGKNLPADPDHARGHEADGGPLHQQPTPPADQPGHVGFSVSVPQPFPPGMPPTSMPPAAMPPNSMPPSSMPPTSMPGYVYINVPLIMPGEHHQREPNQPSALPTTAIPFIPNFQGYPGFPQANPGDVKAEKKFEAPTLTAALSSDIGQSEQVKVKQEPNETLTGMSLPHFPAPQTLEDLEPGEIRHTNRFSNTPGFTSPMANMGMQLPTMVKLEDYQHNQSMGLSQMVSGQAETHSPTQAQSHSPSQAAVATTPHYIDMSTGNVINIQPQRLGSEKSQSYVFENSDFRKQAFISTSFTADDDNCVVDLSMDTTKSEAALAERLSLASNTFSNNSVDIMDIAHQQDDDCALDLSNKRNGIVSGTEIILDDADHIDQPKDLLGEPGMPPTSRPASTASSTSESSPLKAGKKARAGGLNSMVAKLWQTMIKRTKEDRDVNSGMVAETSVSGDGTEHDPITLPGGDDTDTPTQQQQQQQQQQQPFDKLQLLHNVELRATEPGLLQPALKRRNESGEQSTRKTRRKRSKADYCCITYHSCKVCKKLFESADAMWDHALQHADFYNERCDYCEYSAPNKETLHQHCLTAHGVTGSRDESTRTRSEGRSKEYPCKVCGKCLRSPAGLQVHMVRHDEAAERQYTCDVIDCQATFTNQRDCLSHRTRVHKSESGGQRRYQCPHEGCSKNYAKRDGLKHHLMSHTGERPLACNYPGCKKTFREAKHLKIHRLRHTDEKPMQCKLCDYACRQRTSMNWHMKTRHGLEKSRTADNRTIYMNSNTVVIESCESGTAVNTNGDSTVYTEEEVMYQNGGMAMEELETEDEMESPMPSSTDESCAEDGSESNNANPSGGSTVRGNGEDGVLNLTLPLRPDGFESDESGLSAMVAPMPGISSEASFFANVMRMKFPGFSRSLDGKPPLATETKFHTCKICKQLFENVEKMWSHRLVEHDEILKFYCDVCGFSTDTRHEFESHMSASHNRHVTDIKEFVCLWCGREYSSRHGLKQHLLMKHAGDASPTYPCPYDNCENKVLGKQALKLHIQRRHFKAQQEAAIAAAARAAAAAATAEATCVAENNIQPIENSASQGSHQVASSSEERPLVCDFHGCDKTFREAKHLKVHKMLHTDERPLKCLQCQYSCRQRNSMNWHMKSKHSMQKQVSSDGRTIYVPM